MFGVQINTLNIVAALSCEARALIDYYRLRKVTDRPFTLFQSDQDNQINLVLCGVGLINAAAAVAWLGSRTSGQSPVWLNIGTAGHEQQQLGRLNLVHCAQQEGSARKHYPPLVAEWPGHTTALLSCHSPQAEYPPEQAVDMESSAFFYVASKFSDSEVIQSIKVISDNQDHGIEHLNAEFVMQLLKPHTKEIVEYAERLLKLNRSQVKTVDALHLVDHLRSTVSQRALYQELVGKHQALESFEQSVQLEIKQSDSMSKVLQRLRDALLAIAPQAVRLK